MTTVDAKVDVEYEKHDSGLRTRVVVDVALNTTKRRSTDFHIPPGSRIVNAAVVLPGMDRTDIPQMNTFFPVPGTEENAQRIAITPLSPTKYALAYQGPSSPAYNG